jgi:hypothetical protein
MKTFLLSTSIWAAIGGLGYGFFQLPEIVQMILAGIFMAPFYLGSLICLFEAVFHPITFMRENFNGVNNRGE